jgi:hypothetical protein
MNIRLSLIQEFGCHQLQQLQILGEPAGIEQAVQARDVAGNPSYKGDLPTSVRDESTSLIMNCLGLVHSQAEPNPLKSKALFDKDSGGALQNIRKRSFSKAYRLLASRASLSSHVEERGGSTDPYVINHASEVRNSKNS